MGIRFTIIDYTNDPSGISTVIDEPVGWDGIAIRLKRDKTWHGFFDFFDDGYANMQWHGTARNILKSAYDSKGVEAECDLLVEFACSDTDSYELLYSGRFVFSRYTDVCGDMCYVNCGVENDNCLMAFKNRYDQKVNLDSLQPFDHTCVNDTVGAAAEFTAPHKITILGELAGLVAGSSIVITGPAPPNSGTFTIVYNTYDGLGVTTLTVEETVITDSAPITISGCITNFKLEPYDGLNKIIDLPSKILEFKNDWGIKPEVFNYVDEFGTGTAISETKFFYFPFNWSISRVTEITNSNSERFPYAELGSADGSPFDNFTLHNDGIIKLELSQMLRCFAEADIHIDMAGEISIESTDTMNFTGTIILSYGNDIDGYTTVPLQTGFGCSGCSNSTTAISISYDDTILLNDGDRVYVYFAIVNFQYLTGGGGGGPTDPFTMDITIDSANIKVTIATECAPSVAGVYLVNETLSRIAESYTSDCLRVKSDYFGRTDSEPYTSTEAGCGALECITSGLKIRSKESSGIRISSSISIPASPKISMKDAFDGLNAIHNIGMGIEPDTVRGGSSEWIRIEPVEYFYKPDVLITFDGVSEVKREFDQTKVFSTAKIGYSKWETESINGLNDVFGNREYRTSLNQVRNAYDRVCNFIASDYAIEVTRRAFGDTTKDWRYDNDTFIICLKNDYTGTISFNSSTHIINLLSGITKTEVQIGDTLVVTGSVSNNGTYTVTGVANNGLTITVAETLVNETVFDTGHVVDNTRPLQYLPEQNNIDSTANILYPETCLNLRITPARNAIKHLKSIFQSYVNYTIGKLIFTAGNGNFIAEIDLNDGDCILETDTLAENQDLTSVTLVDGTVAAPIYKPEKIIFEYPVSWQQYKTIKANPYGLIGYQCGSGDIEYGWIEDFQLKPTGPNGGLGQFILKPQIIA